MGREHIHFVTGRLAEHALREELARLAPAVGFDYSIDVLNITVAALMTAPWIARRIQPRSDVTRVVLPGFCSGDLAAIETAVGVPVARGPKDLRELPEYFGRAKTAADYGRYDIEILAEINHAPRLKLADIIAAAASLKADGADVIDLGCDPGDTWMAVGDAVRALVDAGHRVSIDSMNPREIELAAKAGAELVLSVNAANRDAASDWGIEVVAVPDEPAGLKGLETTLDFLSSRNVPFRIDAIIEPIGFGFAASLGRYLETRRRWPAAELMMGIGNLTELTDCDSAAVNVLLLGFCQEQRIKSVLTTQVINWARSSVRECDLARRLVYHAVTRRVLPKHVAPELVLLRDEKLLPFGRDQLDQLAAQLKDHNYRIFAEGNALRLMAAGIDLTDDNPFELFRRLQELAPKNLDASHAFYLGYELAKAVTALTLAKQYRQDQPLDWGFLTRPEISHHPRDRTSEEQSPGD